MQTSELKRKQLLLPSMEIMANNGGSIKPAELIEEIIDRFDVPDSVANDFDTETAKRWGKRTSPFRQEVHWMRMDAIIGEYFEKPRERGLWELSEKGYEALGMCAPGVCFTIYETPMGEAIWADVENTVGYLKDDSVNLVFTSPPYPLEVGKKSYGNKTGAYYVQWLTDIAKEWKRAIADDGSIVINLADTWEKGQATRSLYIERLLLNLCDEVGLHLADRNFWECPNKIPSSYHTTFKRVRLNSSHEHLLWLSKTPDPKANNRNVLEPYKNPKGMERMRKRVTRKSASGHLSSTKAFHADNGGRIPHSVIQMANASTDHAFTKACREAGITPHPARMPQGLAEFYIKFLTEVGDHVHDSFLGSGTTAMAAEKLDRRWSGGDKSLEFLKGSIERFKLNGISPVFAA